MAENTASNNDAFPLAPMPTQKASIVNTSVNHPILASFSTLAVKVFLKLYDRYAIMMTERARQISADDGSTIKHHRLVSLKICVDAELLESAIDLGFIDAVKPYDVLDNDTLRSIQNEKAIESKAKLRCNRSVLWLPRNLKLT